MSRLFKKRLRHSGFVRCIVLAQMPHFRAPGCLSASAPGGARQRRSAPVDNIIRIEALCRRAAQECHIIMFKMEPEASPRHTSDGLLVYALFGA